MSSIYDALKRSQSDKQAQYALGSGMARPAGKWYLAVIAAVLVSAVCTMALLYGFGFLSGSSSKPGVKVQTTSGAPKSMPAPQPQQQIRSVPPMPPADNVQPAPAAPPMAAAVQPPPAAAVQPPSAANVDPDRIWELIKKADKLHKKGDLQGAIEIYKGLIAEAPSFIEMYIRLGGLYFEAKEYDKSLNIYLRALKTSPSNAKLLNNIGSVLLTKNEPEKALKYFIQAHRNSGDYVEPLYNMACAYTKLKKTGAALSSLRQACNMQPEARLWAKRDPDLQPLRGEKEFASIVHGGN